MAFLIDTDIIIYGLKGESSVQQWMQVNQNLPKAISAVTYGELIYGAKKSKHPEKNVATAHRIAELFQVIDINKEIMGIYGEIKAKLERKWNRIGDMDLLIASTAIYLNYPLVTDKIDDFRKIDDLELVEWRNTNS